MIGYTNRPALAAVSIQPEGRNGIVPVLQNPVVEGGDLSIVKVFQGASWRFSGLDGMDCKTRITCAACGCVVNSFSTPLLLSPFFMVLSQSADLRAPEAILTQEPRIHP